MEILNNLEPKRVFHYFGELTRIPRGSGNEKQVSDYIVKYAEEHGFRAEQDERLNVRMWIPASPGHEDRKPVILQAHLDMVCTSVAGSDFNFETDPIEIRVEDGFLKANGTTLGADDGAGVAMILAILDDPDIVHPPMRAIFTTAEEIGMLGAQAMDPEWLDGDYLIGLDFSNSKRILVSAGGMCYLDFARILERNELADSDRYEALKIRLDGLKGGHSGLKIHTDLANALQVMAELADLMTADGRVMLESIDGGTLANVVPAEASCVLVYEKERAEEVRAKLGECIAAIRKAYWHSEPDMKFALETGDATGKILSAADSRAITKFVRLSYAGAYRMADDTYTRAECSANPATLAINDGRAELLMTMRSNSEYFCDRLIENQFAIAEMCGWEASLRSRSGAWEYVPGGVLVDQVSRIFREIKGHEPELAQIHAVVEEGVFSAKAREIGRDIEMVNVGCMTYDVHTPNERLLISSVGPTYNMLCEILRTIE